MISQNYTRWGYTPGILGGMNFGQNYTITPTIAQEYSWDFNKQQFRDKK